jgi:hypothetical protein
METKAHHIKKVQLPNGACIPFAMNASSCEEYEYEKLNTYV